MDSHHVRFMLRRQTQAIRKALYVIECNLSYYEQLVGEEQRAKAAEAQRQASAQADEGGTDREA